MSGVEEAITIEGLGLTLGSFSIQDVNLSVCKGEYKVLLGPTGGGKTVLLETIIGLHRPDRGRILVNGELVSERNPEDRNIGYVPQDYSLFPNLTVDENLAFGPRVRGWTDGRTEARVEELAVLLGITHLRGRAVTHLSGGEKQRVAMGRALAVYPEVLILDEPLSALDENRRTELATELRRIQRQVGGSFLHVCHNLNETAQVADSVAILRDGKIVQTGPTEEILYRPQSTFVAEFTGTKNVFAGKPSDRTNGCFELEDGTVLVAESALDSATHVAIRPEAIAYLSLAPAQRGGNHLDIEVLGISNRAASYEVAVRPIGKQLVWRLTVPRAQGVTGPQVGDRASMHVPPETVWPI